MKQNYFKDATPLSYYDIRCRYLNIVHIGIRNTCSAWHNALFHAIWYLAHLVLVDIPLRMLDSWFIFVRNICPKKYFPSITRRVRVAQWVRQLDYLATHTSLSPIRRRFVPGFVNYKKGAFDSKPQYIKFTSCLPMVGGSLRVLRLLPPLKLVAMA